MNQIEKQELLKLVIQMPKIQKIEIDEDEIYHVFEVPDSLLGDYMSVDEFVDRQAMGGNS